MAGTQLHELTAEQAVASPRATVAAPAARVRMSRRARALACALVVLLARAPSAPALTEDDDAMGEERAVAHFTVCFDFGCKSSTRLYLFKDDWRQVRAVLGGSRSAAEERERVARGIAVMERIVGALTPTGADRGGNETGADNAHGQMDCIDESTNTTTYLSLFEADGLLRFHRVRERVYRAPLLLDQHWAAQIEDTASGARYVVDSWPRDNGEPAIVQPLDDWLRKLEPLPLAVSTSRAP